LPAFPFSQGQSVHNVHKGNVICFY